jgi:hypothetical protein
MRVRVVWSDLTYTRTHAFRMRGRTRDPPTSQRDHPFQDIEQGRYTHIPSGKAPMYDERPHATVCDLSLYSYHPRSTLRHPPGKQRKSPVAKKTAALARAPPVAVRFPACDPGTSLPDASLRGSLRLNLPPCPYSPARQRSRRPAIVADRPAHPHNRGMCPDGTSLVPYNVPHGKCSLPAVRPVVARMTPPNLGMSTQVTTR